MSEGSGIRPPPDAVEFSAGVALGAAAGALVALALMPENRSRGPSIPSRVLDRLPFAVRRRPRPGPAIAFRIRG